MIVSFFPMILHHIVLGGNCSSLVLTCVLTSVYFFHFTFRAETITKGALMGTVLNK